MPYKDPEKRKEHRRKYYEENGDRIRQLSREYNRKHRKEGTGNVRKLGIDEVPVHLQSAYDFSSQRIEFVVHREENLMVINRTCISCGKTEPVSVSSVRSSSKKGKLTGQCKPCRIKTGHPQKRGEESPGWAGGRFRTSNGYIMVYRPQHPNSYNNGYISEHRSVMEESLGRILLPGETIHHKNGIRDDNRIENLEVWGNNHGRGQRYDDFSLDELQALIVHLECVMAAKREEDADMVS
jgi:hypothetical protein